MCQQIPSTTSCLFPLADESLHEELCATLERVEQYLSQSIHSDIPLVSRIGSYILESGGKRLRPMLAILSAKASGYEGSDDVLLGSLVEWIHAATLLHDDVLDEADLRRGRPTVRKIWGNRLSVSMGDYAYFLAVSALIHSRSAALAAAALLPACERMVLGELMQAGEQMANRLTPESVYLRIVEYKTGTFIAATCEAGGVLADASEAIRHSLFEFGLALGIGFQLKDDALDYAGRSGKRSGQDLRHGLITLPLLHCFSQCNKREREKLRILLRAKDAQSTLPRINALLLRYGSIEHALARAQHYGSLAKQHLNSLQDSPYKHAMLILAERLLQQENTSAVAGLTT